MARPVKQGLEYFSFDTDFFSDRKVRRIMSACGPNSASILICLLCNIYKDKGYYIGWDKELPFDIADIVGVSEGSVEEVIKKGLQVDFFNQELFQKYSILTSNGIQKRFKSSTLKRKDIEINDDYWVFAVNNSVNAGNIPEETPLLPPESTQKEKKGKEKKRKESIPPKSPEGESDKIDYQKLVDYFNRTFAGKLPTVTQLTDKRKAAIKARMANHGKDAIFKMLLNAAKSPFLMGENNQNWRADFDWIFKPTNFVKILEGNYLKREDDGQTTSNATPGQNRSRKGSSSNGTDAENKRREREYLGRLADAILQESAAKNSQ